MTTIAMLAMYFNISFKALVSVAPTVMFGMVSMGIMFMIASVLSKSK